MLDDRRGAGVLDVHRLARTAGQSDRFHHVAGADGHRAWGMHVSLLSRVGSIVIASCQLRRMMSTGLSLNL